jgi:SAM-dependent methyltransferase
MGDCQLDGELDGILSGFLRNTRKRKIAPYVRNATSILDIGCGLFVWDDIINNHTHYTGIDVEGEILEKNKSGYPEYNFIQLDLNKSDKLKLPENSFDLIVMLASIEHFKYPLQLIKDLKPLLTIRGKIVLTTPAPSGELILDIGAKFRIFAQDKHQHEDLLDKRSLLSLAQSTGFKLTKYERFLFFQNQLAVLEPG